MTKKKDILKKKKQNISKNNNGKRILENKEILDIIFNIENYYYYNQQAFIELIKYLENFLEIIELINIDPQYSSSLYDNLKDLKKLIINTIISFEIRLPNEFNINDVIDDMTNILDKQLQDVYDIHEKYIKENGMNYKIKLIVPNMLDGYNVDDNLLEPKKKLLFNQI